MEIAITGQNVKVTERMRAEITRAANRVAQRLKGFPPDMTQTDVVVDRLPKTGRWQVRITLGAAAPDHTFTSTEEGETLREAVRLAADDHVDQVERFREKIQRKEHTYRRRARREAGPKDRTGLNGEASGSRYRLRYTSLPEIQS
jgi:ribosomal subunit interface protein